MSQPNPEVSDYFFNGCGRCALGGTPECRVHLWPEALAKLRAIALESGLSEVRKWGVPCYVNEKGKNIALLGAFKGHCLIGFFKGALLSDPNGVLESPGSNSQSTRQMRFTDGASVEAAADQVRQFLKAAIEAEAAGKKVEFKKADEYDIPEEFQDVLANDPGFATAFESLTPGRRRAYLMHFGQPKKAETRRARIEKARNDIFNGIGLNDQYQAKMRKKT
jgi:uncharacterized protein YdeI (YjbR/CyaY-like superfamily)